MSKTLTEIAKQLDAANKKIQLIYAFNGMGKTRLSRAFKQFIASKNDGDEDGETPRKTLYYNAFTEDLFYWDNDLDHDVEPKLKIQPNSFTDWILRERGDTDIVKNFQRYANNKLTPLFQEKDVVKGSKKTGEKTYPEVTFSLDTGTERSGNLKISKGEESNFIWSIFYTLFQEVVSILDEPDPNKRDSNDFDRLEYVFIDDPVSSLDENHLIELAVDLAGLVKLSKSDLKFVITTHSPLFYNVLSNELSNKAYEKQSDGTYKPKYKPDKEFKKYRLEKKSDGLFQLIDQPTDSPFSYHLFLLSELQIAIKSGQIRKYHFSFIRNILEKMATFLGYNYWPALLPKTGDGKPDPFANRILNLSSHSAHAGEEITDIEDTDKERLDDLVKYLIETYGFRQQAENELPHPKIPPA
ncbi:MAG: anticodon nuclease [Proteobacteria bacterium ST_bin11]|nr:MAG: anticodon nuclease [Proteobacteria bacterium ST_bin11]